MYLLQFMYKIMQYCGECTGLLTNKIAGDDIVLLSMIAQVRDGGKHIKLNLICDR